MSEQEKPLALNRQAVDVALQHGVSWLSNDDRIRVLRPHARPAKRVSSGVSGRWVTVVVEFQTKEGSIIPSPAALIDCQPILPGQMSPWKVIGTWNPAMARCKAILCFKYLSDGAIPTGVVQW